MTMYLYDKYTSIDQWTPEIKSEEEYTDFSGGWIFYKTLSYSDSVGYSLSGTQYTISNVPLNTIVYSQYVTNNNTLRKAEAIKPTSRINSNTLAGTTYTLSRNFEATKKDFIETVTATEGTYPDNGKHTDGFYYVKKEIASPVNKYLFQDGEEIKKYVQTTTTSTSSAMPIMTGPSTPSGLVTASYETASFEAWNAFDSRKTQTDSSYWYAPFAQAGYNPWIQYDFPTSKQTTISKYSITPFSDNAPVGLTVKGLQNGTWVILDQRTNLSWQSYGVQFFTIEQPQLCTAYRFELSGGVSGVDKVGYALLNIEMYEQITNSSWKTISTTPVTKAMFDTDGLTDLSAITNEAIQKLTSDEPELLCWTDEENATRDLNLTAVPLPQLLLSKQDIEVKELESVSIDAIVNERYTQNLIPVMTSNTLPSGIVTASTESNYNKGYRAFDGDNDLYIGWLTNSYAQTPSYLGYEFTENKNVSKYIIYPSTYLVNVAPTDWTFEGWNGNAWEVLDTRSSVTDWVIGTPKSFIIKNPQSYKKYRIYITAVNGSSTYAGISELQMFESMTSNNDLKIALSGDSGENWAGKAAVNINDLSNFKTNGLSVSEFNALSKEQLKSLCPNGKIRMAFYLEQENTTNALEIRSVTINERLYTMTPEVESLSVLYSLLEAESPDLYVSRDDGVTWKKIKRDELADLSALPEGKQVRVKVVLSNGQELQALSYSWI
ncbi:hypothetical protein ACWA2C_17015 [Priestia megaterium]